MLIFLHNILLYINIMIPEVIEILSDNEEMEVMKDKQFKILQRQLEDKAALLKSPVGVMLAVSMESMKGTPEEKERVLMERIQKMFMDKQKLDISKQHFCLRRQPNLNKEKYQVILNEIIVFGTDFWTTTQIRNQAKGLKIQLEALKIDDSHTKLIFSTFDMAKKWLQFYIMDKSLLKTKMEQQQLQDNEIEIKEGTRLKGWFDLESYRFQGFNRIRQARFCLDDQKDINALQQDTKTTKYEKFKKMIEQQFTKNDDVKMSYQMVYQREYNQPKYKKNSDFSMFRNHQQRSFNNRSRGNFTDWRQQRQRYPNRQRRQRSGERQRSRERTRQKRSHHHNYRDNEYQHNKTTMNRTINRTNNFQQRQNRTSMVNQTMNNDQNDNFSTLLDKVNNDNADNNDIPLSIEKQLNMMKIQDPLNMSIDLVERRSEPNVEDDNKSNMSVVLQPEGNMSKNKSRVVDNSQARMSVSFLSEQPMQKPVTKPASKPGSFDYYKYIEEQQKKTPIKSFVYKPPN